MAALAAHGALLGRDRIVLIGCVVGALRTGIFNVADMAILLGVGLLLLGRRERGGEAAPAA